MLTIELADISAEISQLITEWNPLFVKVARVIDKRTFQLTPSKQPVHADDFWADPRSDALLSPAEKAKLHLQYHRSNNCVLHVHAFVFALKELCDRGITFSHKGQPVVDIWVLNTTELDVSDILENRVLTVIDPISGLKLPTLITYQSMERLRKLGLEVCKRFGLGLPGRTNREFKRSRPISYESALPHWWVAAIIEAAENDNLGFKERRMVHIDVCGAAYDDSGFTMHDGSLVSLQIFPTPEHSLLPIDKLSQSLQTKMLAGHKFVMEPYLNPNNGGWESRALSSQPFSVRHLRCFNKTDSSAIGVTTVDMFVARESSNMPGNMFKWHEIVTQLCNKVLRRVPAGTAVEICNLEKRPTLNGCSGRVLHSVPTNPSNDRILVKVKGVAHPISVKTICIRLKTRNQYLSYADLLKSVKEALPRDDECKKIVSDSEKEAFQAAFEKGPNIKLALEVLKTGKSSIIHFADPQFAKGIRKLLLPPFDGSMPPSLATNLRNCLEVADHENSAEAFEILKMIKVGKEKAVDNEAYMQGDGSIVLSRGSNFHRLLEKIVERIKQKQGLMDVFEMMDHYKLFRNPIKETANWKSSDV